MKILILTTLISIAAASYETNPTFEKQRLCCLKQNKSFKCDDLYVGDRNLCLQAAIEVESLVSKGIRNDETLEECKLF